MKDNIRTILIVDDEMEVLKLLKDIFESRNWRVFITPTGNSAIPMLEKEKIDIVLLDIRLPDKSGIEVLQDLRPKFPDVPVVMLTAYGYDETLVEKTIGVGASGYVSKTVSTEELLMAVNNAMRK